MKYDFDTVVDYGGNHFARYDEQIKRFGTDQVIPLQIVDMDFKAAQPIVDTLTARTQEGIWGYTSCPDSYFKVIRGWQRRRNGWNIGPSLMSSSLGVVQSISAMVRLSTPEGGGTLIQTPVYSEFYDMTEVQNQKVLENPFVEKDDRWEMDRADFEARLAEADLFLLCNPHNPLGIVRTPEELCRMVELCTKYWVVLFSDEIHFGLVFHGKRHTPTASTSDEAAWYMVTGISSTKTLSLTGLQASTVVFPNVRMKRVFDQFWMNMDIHRNNAFSLTAMETAFSYGEEWLEQLPPYLPANFDFVADYYREHTPQIRTCAPGAIYLMWPGYRALGLNDDALRRFMIEQAGLDLDGGCSFGHSLNGYVRLNAVCPRSMLEWVMKQFEAAVKAP